jgi:hypothetical protein
MKCRACGTTSNVTFLDLGSSPIANALVNQDQKNLPSEIYPLVAMVCSECSLVQLSEILPREDLFDSSYVYYSSYSTSWLDHCKDYAIRMAEKLHLNNRDLVIEIASNDGYLLQYFRELNVQVLGVEPSSGVADVAKRNQIPTVVDFFGQTLAKKLSSNKKPKLLIGNNVLAHVPDLHDFIHGFSILIADDGIITFEFPHLQNLIKLNQFDTIYHEHYSYLNLTPLVPLFREYGLRVFDVEKLSTHGGSLRIYVSKAESNWIESNSVSELLEEESELDPRNDHVRGVLQSRVGIVRDELIRELTSCKQKGLKVVAYGAAAKGNTLLNFCGIDSDLVEYVMDLNPHKQGNYLPGSRIPIVGVGDPLIEPPHVILVLPWNLAHEIKEQLEDYSDEGVRFLRAIPKLEYF